MNKDGEGRKREMMSDNQEKMHKKGRNMEETVAIQGLSSQITKAHTSFGFNCTDFQMYDFTLVNGLMLL